MIYVLDSFALLAFFWQEKGYRKVKLAFEQVVNNQATIHMSRVNFGETFYMAWKKRNSQNAEKILLDIVALPIIFEEATESRIMAAARLKAHYTISYADAFAAVLAQELNATLLTGDPEFKSVEHLITIDWLN